MLIEAVPWRSANARMPSQPCAPSRARIAAIADEWRAGPRVYRSLVSQRSVERPPDRLLWLMAGFGGGASGTRLQRPDAPAGEFVVAEFSRVSPRYFAAAAIPVLRGRVFADTDGPASTVVVLDEQAANQLFGDRDPLGREVISHGSNRVTVIGVVFHVSTRGPEPIPGRRLTSRVHPRRSLRLFATC